MRPRRRPLDRRRNDVGGDRRGVRRQQRQRLRHARRCGDGRRRRRRAGGVGRRRCQLVTGRLPAARPCTAWRGATRAWIAGTGERRAAPRPPAATGSARRRHPTARSTGWCHWPPAAWRWRPSRPACGSSAPTATGRRSGCRSSRCSPCSSSTTTTCWPAPAAPGSCAGTGSTGRGGRSPASRPTRSCTDRPRRRRCARTPAPGKGVVRADDDGERWTPVGTSLAHHRIFSVLASADGSVFAGSYDGVWVMRPGADDWSPVDTGLDVGAAFTVAVDDDGTAFAGGRAGVFRTADRGDHLVVDQAGGTHRQRILLLPHPRRRRCWSAPTTGCGTPVPDWPGEAWQRAGLDGHRVFTLIEVTPGRLLAGTLGAGVWLRPDAAASWQPSADGLDHPLAFDLMRSPSTGEVFVATGVIEGGLKSGGIFRSADGERWQAAALDANTVYDLGETSSGVIVAGAQRCRVLRSTDGGRSFRDHAADRARRIEDVLPDARSSRPPVPRRRRRAAPQRRRRRVVAGGGQRARRRHRVRPGGFRRRHAAGGDQRRASTAAPTPASRGLPSHWSD